MKPKTTKSFLKLCLAIAHANRDELKGIDKLSEDEYRQLGNIRASIQNELCDMTGLLDKNMLKYNSGEE